MNTTQLRIRPEPTYIWPNVFTNLDFEYDLTDEHTELQAIADGLEGWALVCAQVEPPHSFEAFCQAMLKVGKVTGCVSMDSLSRKAAKLGL